jgi:mannose-6-phosphate isomerase
MSVKDADAKIWPQTERVKAWCAMLERAGNETEAERARQGIVAAAGGLMRYFLETPAGLWHEVCGPDGGFAAGPSKASSFYHVVCAIEVLRRSVGAHLDMVSPGADFL